ncbi:hypothetical protein MHYP_G00152090 [Metynnis hypsauchen]
MVCLGHQQACRIEQTLQQFNTTLLNCGNAPSSNSSICTGIMPLQQTNKGGPLMCKIGQSWVQATVLTLSSNSGTNTSSSNSTKAVRASNVQLFTKTSSFSNFLHRVVGTFPPKASTTSTTTTTTVKAVVASAAESCSLLSITSLLLLSLPALFQMFS